MPSQEHVRELLDLIAVHGFYIELTKQKLGHEIPLPREASSPERAADKIEHSASILRNWLALLDLAIQPVQLRDALKSELSEETAQALVRYFIDKRSHTETDRDKIDFIATSVFRRGHMAELNAPDSHDRYTQIMQSVDRFEREILKIV